MKEKILGLVGIFQAYPYPLIFFGLLGCGLGLPLPEEFFLVMSGYVSYRNHVADIMGLLPMLVVTWLAIGGGDLLAFSIGRKWGPRVFETRLLKRLVSDSGRAKAEQFLKDYGSKTILAARFLPGIRMPTYLLCGTLNVSVWTFMFFDGLAMAVSVPTQVLITWHYGEVLEDALHKVARLNQIFLMLAIITVVFVYYRIHSGRSALPTSGKTEPAKVEEGNAGGTDVPPNSP